MPILFKISGAISAALSLGFITSSATGAQERIDTRISVSHVSGIYPRISGGRYLEYGAKNALALGFQNIEIYLNPSICLTRGSPAVSYGIYQNVRASNTLNWCNNNRYADGGTDYELRTEFSNLKALASKNLHYKSTINLPFRTIFLTVDPVQYKKAAYSISIGAKDKSGLVVKFTNQQLKSLYKEIYDLSVYLISNFHNSNKTFVLLSGNEIDWALLGGVIDPELNPDPTAIENAIAYWNTVQSAIQDARKEDTSSKARVYQACEVNLLMKAMRGGITATNNVIPYTHCDLYGYSSYDTTLPVPGFNKINFQNAVKYLKYKAPASKDFGSNNIFISEIGLPERNYPPKEYNTDAKMQNIAVLKQQISEALSLNLPYINVWTLYDNECSKFGPKSDLFSSSGCPGYWMVKPSGATSSTYRMIADNFRIR